MLPLSIVALETTSRLLEHSRITLNLKVDTYLNLISKQIWGFQTIMINLVPPSLQLFCAKNIKKSMFRVKKEAQEMKDHKFNQ